MFHDAGTDGLEYQALHTRAVLVDRSARGRMRFTGAKPGEVLTGLVTNDVLALAPGTGQYAAALTAKGRIIADPRILAGDGWYLADVPERARAGWNALIQKFVNPRLAKYVDETETTCATGVFGPAAATVVARALAADAGAVAALAMYAHMTLPFGGGGDAHALVVRVPDAGVDGFEIIAPSGARGAITSACQAAGAVAASAETLTIARVEAGRPEYGVDMDDSTIPQEANLDELGAISYSKGCYTGQEVVARVHFRGHVNRHLRGLQGEPAAAPAGARLIDPSGDGAEVGDVRTSVVSPGTGPIAIGMVRREVPVGATLTATWDGGTGGVRVVALPFRQ